MTLDKQQTIDFIEQSWEQSIIPTLSKYIKIPCKSPLFDCDWQKNGFMDQAVDLLTNWCNENALRNMKLEVLRAPERTPLIYIDIPGSKQDDTIVLYGHLDKQPEMVGWDPDLGPWKPVYKNNKLYGRGSVDDGYALFSALNAISSLQQQNIPHARCVILIEACEESGSDDFPYYLDQLRNQLGEPSLVIALDSGCGNYESLWVTTSLRGGISGDLKVDVLTEGVHSGNASGIVPSSFRILRQLLSRIEDEKTGKILMDELYVDIPKRRQEQVKKAAEILNNKVYSEFPFVEGMQPAANDLCDLILNRTWRPALSLTGMDGIPPISEAGNVLRPYTTLKLSMRTPPTCDVEKATRALKETLEKDSPYHARVTYTPETDAPGWNAPLEHDWLGNCLDSASQNFFGNPAVYMGEGGSIPLIGLLGEKFPKAQFLITGALGPHSNAHGPNECLDIPAAKKLTCCIAQVIMAHFGRTNC